MYTITNVYNWNPWIGCRGVTEGCAECIYNKGSRIIVSNSKLNFPVIKRRQKRGQTVKDGYPLEYRVEQGSLLYTCTNSDFFIHDADFIRSALWEIVHKRYDCLFVINTRRIWRIEKCLPSNWLDGYSNVIINCIIEDNETAWENIPSFLELPIKHKGILIKPMLEPIDISPFLCSPEIEHLIVSGTPYGETILDYEWVEELSNQCKEYNMNFYFEHTGNKLRRNGRVINIPYRDGHNLAEFYDLSLEFTSTDWQKTARDLELQNLAEQANELYRKIAKADRV